MTENPDRHSLWPAASKSNHKKIMMCLQWALPPLQWELPWRSELSPGLPGCSHLQFHSLFYSWIKNTGKITEAMHKKRNEVTSVWHYRAWSLPFPHFTFCILDDFTPSMKHRSTVTAALPWWANTIQDTFSPIIFCCWNISALLQNCLCT